MIQKGTILSPADKCGIITCNVFHIYKGFKKKQGICGDFLKFSSKLVLPDLIELKGQKFNGIFVRSTKFLKKIDGSLFFNKINSIVVLKKRLTPKGKEILGPASKSIKRKKFLSSFSGIY